jgi:HD-GYP domain-containing protein (c-di-GMP phosphodiesterase class II)
MRVTHAWDDDDAEAGPARADNAWDVLERFGQALQQCQQSAQQIRLILLSTQDALGADAVYWHPGAAGDSAETVGRPELSAAWRRDFTSRLLAEASGPGELTQSHLDPGSKPAAPWPASVALLRISRSRGSWLVALSFHPRRQFGPADLRVLRLARRMLLNHRQQAQVYEKLRDSLFGLVRCLTAAIDAKDPYTWGHSERVARMAVRLGRQLELPENALSDLYLAGLLHDIGKIGVRDDVLRKPDKLTPEEVAHIQEHPVIGDRLVGHIQALQHLRPGVRNHHERWDGHGYPDGQAGEEIALQARVLAVADSCDAMMHTRPYRDALPPDRVESTLRAGAGTQWDPHVVAAFQVCRHDLYSICERGLGDSVFAAVERALKAGQAVDESTLRRPPER